MNRGTCTLALRKTKDKIEKIGIKKTLEKAKKSDIILLIIDASKEINSKELVKQKNKYENKIITVINKIDIKKTTILKNIEDAMLISAKEKIGIQDLKNKIVSLVKKKKISNSDTIITNIRHYDELKLALNEINLIFEGLNSNLSSEFLSIHIRQALSHVGIITGEVTTDTLLGNIFQKFCIGK
jgi:tRNA modification GTPase